jgi:indole-3-glycerol phosphate synthase
VLRKDFLLDEYQVYESRAAGADAVLLIGECLRESELIDMLILSHELRMTVLLEFHDPENFFRVQPHLSFPDTAHTLLGINNRDLNTMTTDLNHSLRMSTLIPDASRLVSESGISTRADIERLHAAGIDIVLVGESLMKQADPGAALAELIGDRAG